MAVETTDTEQVIQLFRQAAEANRRTPLRKGNVIELPTDAGGEVMITADLHGNRLHFERILEIAALGQHPQRHLVLQEVCHGGPSYPSDGGCMSHLVLEDVARLKLEFPEQVHFLLSNHELAEATDFVVAKGGRMLNMHFRFGLKDLYGTAADNVHHALSEFILSCPIALRCCDGVFVSHSLPARSDSCPFFPGVLDESWSEDDIGPDGAVFRLVWGRDFRRENAAAFGELVGARLLIHGHEPCAHGYQVPNDLQVILDGCGPYASYAMLPLDQKVSHDDIVKHVRRLNP